MIMATIAELEQQAEEIRKQRVALRGSNNAEDRILDQQLAQQQKSINEQLILAKNSQENSYSLKRAGLNSWGVYDQNGRLVSLGKSPDDAIEGARNSGARPEDLAKISSPDQVGLSDPVKTPSATNQSQTDLDTQEKYASGTPEFSVDSSDPLQDAANSLPELSGDYDVPFGERAVPGVPEGAERPRETQTKVNVNSLRDIKGDDLRVKIRVPPGYISSEFDITTGPRSGLGETKIGGIIFPYTPSINFDMKADYTSVSPLHSNFPINFYKSSGISNINIQGKFTVENDSDAGFYIATVHLLRSLTKMRFGTDWNKGAPPPVCRLDAYGALMLKNVPVAISNFRIELPDSVDYYTFEYQTQGLVSVPTLSTISVTCIPMYSRKEMQEFSVTGYLGGNFLNRGIL